jgi:hypothetical protein
MVTSRLLIFAIFLGAAVGAAQAQAPTPYQKSTEKAGNEQKQAAEAWKVNDKKYTQCKGQAAAQKLHLGKRRQFIKKCMAE